VIAVAIVYYNVTRLRYTSQVLTSHMLSLYTNTQRTVVLVATSLEIAIKIITKSKQAICKDITKYTKHIN
jgi:hypothetical protein